MRKGDYAGAALWNLYYKKNIIPWQSLGLSKITIRYLIQYAKGRRILEVGCGTGAEATGLEALGFIYQGFDVSKVAIVLARKTYPTLRRKFFVSDFFSIEKHSEYSVLYDKGVFHNLFGVRAREKFVRQAAHMLEKDGIWITVCGSADLYSPRTPHGALFLQHIIAPAELYFEVLEVVKAPYGTKENEFDGWYCVFRRR